MKKILATILTLVMVACAFVIPADAKTSYTAAFSMTATANGKNYGSGSTIEVTPGSTVSVKLALKVNCYVGSVSYQIFYNSKIFTGSTISFNKDGKLCKATPSAYRIFNDWGKIAQPNRETWLPDYPSAQKQAFAENHHFSFTSFINFPNIVGNIDETLATYTFTVSSTVAAGTTGQIIIPKEALHRKDYINGKTMVTVCESADADDHISDYSGLSYDMSKAVLNFKVVSGGSAAIKGDINGDKSVNSSDALLVLQGAVGKVTLTAAQKAVADVNGDKAINSSDALLILQYSVGKIKSL